MKRRLDNLIDVLSLSNDERSTWLALSEFARQCGFERFAYVNVRSGETEAFTNYPDEWQEIYLANDYQKLDPVITTAKRGLKPFYWSATPLQWASTSQEREFYKEARTYGIVSGLSIPIRIGYNHTAILTLASHLPNFKGEGTIDDIQAVTATTLVYAALRARVPWSKAPVHLSRREKQCLNWAALGKSMALTADILEISQNTVRYYLEAAKVKLGAHNTMHAVYLAARLDLI